MSWWWALKCRQGKRAILILKFVSLKSEICIHQKLLSKVFREICAQSQKKCLGIRYCWDKLNATRLDNFANICIQFTMCIFIHQIESESLPCKIVWFISRKYFMRPTKPSQTESLVWMNNRRKTSLFSSVAHHAQ